MRIHPIVVLLLASISVFAQNTPSDSIPQQLDEVLISTQEIFGSKFVAQNRTGSSYYISSEEMERFSFTDISRTLSVVPGVNIYEEDGFGLRPNISLRGTSPERSAKISIMEDGVLIAPAPYSSPSAYYFPSVARMQAVEILKGSSQVQYGPYTTGGAINMVSTQIPDEFYAALDARYGSFNSGRYHVRAGDKFKNIGYNVEYLKYNSTGFKDVDNRGDSGFDIDEVVAKLRFNTDRTSAIQQAVDLKFQYSDEVSNETYVGLTPNDFAQDPYRRYAGSQEDVMNANHLQIQATHSIDFSDNIRITTTGYNNQFERNWYKLQSVQINDESIGLGSVLDNPIENEAYLNILKGTVDSDDNALILRNNNREYTSAGLQTKLDYHWNGANTFNDIEVGLRYHFDEEDRFQWEDGYRIINGLMELTNPGTPGTQANRISDAKAFSAYATYKMKWNQWTFTPGIRYENITLSRQDYGRNDINRNGTDLNERTNELDIFIPGIGFAYKFDNSLSAFGGIHKGFAPPGSSPDEDPEESINYELGARFNLFGIGGEVVGFFNDYSNLLGADTASSGGTGSLEQFNAGEVNVSGLEVLLNYTLFNESKVKVPLTIAYTYTQSEFQSSFESAADLWGTVNAGDALPYLSENQLTATAAVAFGKWELNLNGRYNSGFRTIAGSDPITSENGIPEYFLVDFGGTYRLNQNINITANVINLLDNQYAVSRVPAGLRPGHPFGAYAGIQLRY